MHFSKGQFGFDLAFLQSHFNPVILRSDNEQQQVIVIPELQGRIMTSTAAGLSGKSFGWINHELIASKKILKNINPFGGEDRFWMGPEAGQFGLFFKHGDEFTFENSQVPDVIDTTAYDVVNHDHSNIELTKEASLTNYANTEFKIRIGRRIRMLNHHSISEILEIDLNKDVDVVAFESNNSITNLGNDWKKETGLLSIWMIGVFNATDQTTVIIPINDSKLGINENYFGSPDSSRLKIVNDTVYFKGDGSFRSKIGIAPSNTKPVLGSYDFENDVMTIVQFSFRGEEDYVNSMWEIQKEPYGGDVLNSYNDGPLKHGAPQLGKFYELETSSPAKELKTGESILHAHRTFHFRGKKEHLISHAKKILNVDITNDPLMMY